MQRASGILLHISSLPNIYGFGTMGEEAYNFVDFLKEGGFKYWQILPLNPTNESGSPFQSYCVFAGNINLIDLTPYLTKNEKQSFLNESINFFENDETFNCNNLGNLDNKDASKNFNASIVKEDIYTNTFYNKSIENRNENNDVLDDNVKSKLSEDNSTKAFCNKINFTQVYNIKIKYLKKIYKRNFSKIDMQKFIKQNSFWLNDYAIFCVLKDRYKTPYWLFPKEFCSYNKNALEQFKQKYSSEINFYIFTQYLFFEQWSKLKNYANNKGIKIFGDIAFYPSFDSSDVWANKQDFCFDINGTPNGVAGVPPDYFSKEGQLWGSPIYNIKNMKDNNYNFWVKRLEHANTFFDVVRLDHFRGFESFWAVKDYKSENAINGKWQKSLGLDFFKVLNGKKIPILVAEDLGIITKDVKKLIDNLGIAGMKVFQFAFDGNPKNSYFPHNYVENCVAYLGTHDNNTFIGFLENDVSIRTLNEIKNYLGQQKDATNNQILDMAFSVILNSRADTVILTMQDILYLDKNYRMNTPGTTTNNWCFRLNNNYNTNELKNFLLKLNISANRA